jgi:hypothetical protein
MIATSQQAGRPEAYPTRTLPPSERDFEIYQMVVGEGQSTRAAAREVGLSQTRIVQICDRVAEWIGSEVPPTAKLTPAQRLVVAVDIAERRFDFLYSESMEGWRERKGQPGDVRYLSQAMRIAERRIVVSQREATARQAIEKAIAVVKEAGDRGQEPEAINNPPDGGCSGEAAVRSVKCEAGLESIDVSDCQPMVSDDAKLRRGEFLEALEPDLPPVQPPVVDSGWKQLEDPVEMEFDDGQFEPIQSAGSGPGLKVCLDSQEESPQSVATQSRPLNRKERRARERMRRRALARKRR